MDSNNLHSSELGTWLQLTHSNDLDQFCNLLEETLERVFYESVFKASYEFVTRAPDFDNECFTDIVITVNWPIIEQRHTIHQKEPLYVNTGNRVFKVVEPAKIFCRMITSHPDVFMQNKANAIASQLETESRKEFLYGR